MRKVVIGGILAALVVALGVLYVNYDSWIGFRTHRSLISEKLKDPESTKFRNEHLTSTGWLCGELNSKNGTGGYGGFKRFFVRAKDDAWLEGEGSLNQLSTAEFIELLDEKTAVTKTYIELRKVAPNVEVPSEYYRDEQAKKQFFEKKWAATCQ